MKSLGGSLAGAPSAVLYAPDHLDGFATGPGNMLWRWWLECGAMQGPAPLPAVPGGVPAEGICAVSSGGGRIEAFAAAPGNNPFGPRNTLWWWRFDGTSWTGPTPLPPGANLLPVPVAAVASGPNSIDVFAAGAGNTPHWWHWDGATWSAPVPLPVGADLPPERIAAISAGPGRLDLFAAGRAGNQLWHWWREPGSGWRLEPLLRLSSRGTGATGGVPTPLQQRPAAQPAWL